MLLLSALALGTLTSTALTQPVLAADTQLVTLTEEQMDRVAAGQDGLLSAAEARQLLLQSGQLSPGTLLVFNPYVGSPLALVTVPIGLALGVVRELANAARREGLELGEATKGISVFSEQELRVLGYPAPSGGSGIAR